jgi:hypothetical protein
MSISHVNIVSLLFVTIIYLSYRHSGLTIYGLIDMLLFDIS